MFTATKGVGRAGYIQNRQVVGYPNPNIINKPIEKAYNKKKWLPIRLPADLRVVDIKWLSIWCEIFKTSFGEVNFPALAVNTKEE